MRAIFLCEKSDQIFKVYDSKTLCYLQGQVEIEKKIYNKADILAEPASFADVKFIFSTWGMPLFAEDEIKACLPSLECVYYGAGTVQAFARPFLNCRIKVFLPWCFY